MDRKFNFQGIDLIRFDYCVVLKVPKDINHWLPNGQLLRIDGETQEVQIIQPVELCVSIRVFLDDRQNLVEEQGETFGERINYTHMLCK
jgi:hypothetical protein